MKKEIKFNEINNEYISIKEELEEKSEKLIKLNRTNLQNEDSIQKKNLTI